MSAATVDELLVVGRITGCYGIRGWVRIHPFTEQPDALLAYGHWQVRRREGPAPLPIDHGRVHGKGLVAHIAGVDDRSAAEALRGLDIVVSAVCLPSLAAGEFYWHQLQGLAVWCGRGEDSLLLGEVQHLIETGANDVLVVCPCPGSLDDRERLIPWLPGRTVTQVDLDAGRLEVDWFPEDI